MVTLNSTVTFLLSSFSYFYANEDLIVNTKYGRLEGTTGLSRNGRNYYEFLGVPFAKPPIGDLRFQPPVPPDPWDGVRSASSIGYECIQINIIMHRQVGDENCLFLNVHTHQIQKAGSVEPIEKLHPVIVYIHGGIFMTGGTRIYGGRYFMDEDVVLVVVQYRLGAFGFLNTGDDIVRGNMGLKDQTIALKWVQENIKTFGGDPNRVTLVGQSAGAACAHLHMLSPLSRGLFHQVVTQSGNALSPWALKRQPIEQALRFGAKINCPTNTTQDMVSCMMNMSADDVVQGHNDFPYQLYDKLVIFGPTIEVINDTHTFLDEDPVNLLNSDRSMLIPWLNGVNSEEGLLFAAKMIINETVQEALRTNWTTYGPLLLSLEQHPNKYELSEQIRDYYLGTNITNLTMSDLVNLTDMMSDRNFFQSSHDITRWHLEQQNLIQADQPASAAAGAGTKVAHPPPMYLYYYSYKGEISLGNFILKLTRMFPQALDAIVSTGLQWISTNVFGYEQEHYGAGHADEIFLLFKLPILTQHEKGAKDFAMSETMVDIWTSFAKDGKPQIPGGGGGCWKPVGEWCPIPVRGKNHTAMTDSSTSTRTGRFQYMKLDNESYMIEEPFSERLAFWEDTLNLKFI